MDQYLYDLTLLYCHSFLGLLLDLFSYRATSSHTQLKPHHMYWQYLGTSNPLEHLELTATDSISAPAHQI